MTAAGLAQWVEPWRFDATAKHITTPAMLAARLRAAMDRRRDTRGENHSARERGSGKASV